VGYECLICNRKFKTLGPYIRHLRQAHNLKIPKAESRIQRKRRSRDLFEDIERAYWRFFMEHRAVFAEDGSKVYVKTH